MMTPEEEEPILPLTQPTGPETNHNNNIRQRHSSVSSLFTEAGGSILKALLCFGLLAGLLLLLGFFVVNYTTLLNNYNNSNNTTHENATTVQNYNTIDACWRNDPNWSSNRKKLADCASGFGRNAIGGKYGDVYVVTDDSDDTVNPAPGTLRYGLLQSHGFLWITFARDMSITLQGALFVPSHTTIDGRGAHVTIGNGGPCLVLRSVRHVIVHGIHLDRCTGGFNGDGITVFNSEDVWIDHNWLSSAYDGLIDVVHGSTDVTISNNYFEKHNKVMLMGHSDLNKADVGLRVSLAYNKFGPKLTQRMPRCRFGYCHVVNNEYSHGWGIYAMGGSSRPTIVSEGNFFRAPESLKYKRVTKCMNHGDKASCDSLPWISNGDTFLEGSYFITPLAEAPSPISSSLSDHDHEESINAKNEQVKIIDDGILPHLPFAHFLTASAGPLSCTPGLPC